LFSAVASIVLSHRCLLFAVTLIFLFFAGDAISSTATATSDFSALLNETEPLTPTITTDQEALAMISSLLMDKRSGTSAFQRKRSRKIRKISIPDELTQSGIQLIREIAIFHWASQFLNLLENQPLSTAQSTYVKQQAFLTWVRGKPPQSGLNKVLTLTETLLELSTHSSPTNATWNGYRKFSQYIWETYPDWKGTDSAWLTVAEQEGASGILWRLQSYWKTDALNNDQSQSERVGNKDAHIGRFLQQQVIPISKTHLEISLFQLQTQYERRAWETWRKIQARKTQQHEREGLTRLCGTWQWLIHNHQNHGDHKTIMVYPPPSQYERMDPQPAKIQVQGDTVYIRWEFPNGIIQEESLLLSEKDRMLSGTFVNNMGPNGNITGRRMAPCKNR